MTESEVVQLILKVTGAESLDDLKSKAASTKDGLEDMAGAGGRAETSSRNLGRAVLESGRGLQDFAQGGIGGVINNIEGLAVALGGGPGLAGILTAVGVAAVVAGPAIKSLWSSITEGSNKIPESADALERMSDSLKAVKDRLAELKDQGSLTSSELIEYNDALARRIDLEARIADERAVAAVDSSAGRSRGAAFRRALEEYGGGDAFVAKANETDPDRRASLLDDLANALKGDEASIARVKARDRTFDSVWNRHDPDQVETREIEAADEKRRLDAENRAAKWEADKARAAARAAREEDEQDAMAERHRATQEDRQRDRMTAWQARSAVEETRRRDEEAEAALPQNRLRAMRDEMLGNASGIALAENNGEFNPAQLDAIAREAANDAAGPDLDSIRQAIYRAAWETRRKVQADLDRQMGAMQYNGDPYYGY